MKRLLLILMIFVLFSCEEKTNWSPAEDNPQYVIIEGLLTNENKVHNIHVSLSSNALNVPNKAISNASVIVSTSDSSWIFNESLTEPGFYQSPAGWHTIPNINYSLLVGVESRVYTAKAQSRNVGVFEFLHYTQSTSATDKYYITWVSGLYNANNPAMYEILLDWSKVGGYQALPYYVTHASLYYFSLPFIDVNELFAPEAEKILFPKGTKIIEKKYSLSEDQATFYRSLLLETNWKGGYLDVAPANITTNISGGALGFFGVSQVIADSSIVE